MLTMADINGLLAAIDSVPYRVDFSSVSTVMAVCPDHLNFLSQERASFLCIWKPSVNWQLHQQYGVRAPRQLEHVEEPERVLGAGKHKLVHIEIKRYGRIRRAN